MKYRTTRKYVLENSKPIGIGYCDAQYLLYFHGPVAYTAGVYGWRADIYHIDNYVITTGYGPIGDTPPYELTKRYNDLAMAIVHDTDMDWQERRARVDALLHDFIKEATK